MLFTALAAFIATTAIQVTRAAQIDVTVGGTGVIAFSPESVTAAVGDVIVFNFKQKNHTATQSSLQNPCQPASGGFDSSFVPVAANNTDGPFPQAMLTVQDTNAIWVYCKQATHCQQGMVFAVNPGNNFTTFKANAMGNSTTSSGLPPASSSGSPTNVGQPTTSPSPSPTSPSSGTSSDHVVVVGGTGLLAFNPPNITAQVGDTITFQFKQKNHTATQSSFASPCQPLQANGVVGFDSEYMPVADSATVFPTYTIQVNNTSPIWVYCKQAGHCSQGMVFAANALESGPNNFEAFQAKAKGLTVSGSSSSPASTSSPTGSTNTGGAIRPGAGAAMGVLSILVGSLVLF